MPEKSIKNSIFFERLSQIIDYYGIKNTNDFALNYLGYKSSQKINRLKEENTSPSFEILNDISNKFESINVEWLLTGRGQMLKNEENKHPENINDTTVTKGARVVSYNFKSDYFNINNQLIPLYEVEASAGLNVLFSNQSDQSPIDYISVPNAPKCNGALFVRGDSMYPIMKSGDIVCYKHITNLQNNIRFGEIYLLYIDDGDDEYLTIKYVQSSDRGKDFVKLVSHNLHHAPKDEHISHIKGLAIIKLSIRYNTIS